MAEPRDRTDSDTLDYLERAGKIRPIKKRAPADQASESPTSSRTNVVSGLESFAARAVLEAVRRLEGIKGGGSPGVRLSECAKDIGISGEVLIPLSRQLEEAGLLRNLESDPFGDNLVSLTEHGASVLDSPDPITVLSSLLSA